MINIYGTGEWAKKITSLLPKSEYGQYDSYDYDQAPASNSWIIALEDGTDRLSVANGVLAGSTFETLFKGCQTLDDVTVGEGCVIGCCSLVRPGTSLGNQVYIGAGTIIDINCKIGNSVTIGDNVTVYEGVSICDGAYIQSGQVITKDIK